MNITEKLLTANGWDCRARYQSGGECYIKWFQDDWYLEILFHEEIENGLEIRLGFWVNEHWGNSISLPAIRTMEQLALLFALLGDEPDPSALEARLHDTLVPVATPPGLRLRAGAREGKP